MPKAVVQSVSPITEVHITPLYGVDLEGSRSCDACDAREHGICKGFVGTLRDVMADSMHWRSVGALHPIRALTDPMN